MDDGHIFKKHERGCKRRSDPTATNCDCAWWGQVESISVDLARWTGREIRPRKKRPAQDALRGLWVALLMERYSPLGEKFSQIGMKDLLKEPYRVTELHAEQLPAMLDEISIWVRRATDVRDHLARRIPGSLRINGRPLKEVRGLLRLDDGSGISFDNAADWLRKDDEYGVRRFLADLVTDSWLVQDKPDHWTITDKARELQTTSRGRLKRERAQAALAGLMERIHSVNADDQYAFKVEVVVVFGSYLSELPRIGDVDVAVRLKERGRSKDEQKQLEAASFERTSRRLATVVEQVLWPRNEVMTVLKARQPSIDLRELGEIEGLFQKGANIRYEVLQGHWIPPSPDVEPGK
jgi:hypothetical protein